MPPVEGMGFKRVLQPVSIPPAWQCPPLAALSVPGLQPAAAVRRSPVRTLHGLGRRTENAAAAAVEAPRRDSRCAEATWAWWTARRTATTPPNRQQLRRCGSATPHFARPHSATPLAPGAHAPTPVPLSSMALHLPQLAVDRCAVWTPRMPRRLPFPCSYARQVAPLHRQQHPHASELHAAATHGRSLTGSSAQQPAMAAKLGLCRALMSPGPATVAQWQTLCVTPPPSQ